MKYVAIFLIAIVVIGIAYYSYGGLFKPLELEIFKPSTTLELPKTTKQETLIQTIERITPREAYALIQKNKDNLNFIILDVRTPEEFVNEHIDDAINLNYYSETFRDDLNGLDKNKTYLIYCRSGSRSGIALEIMKELGFREVYDMSGGITAWKAEGLPTTR
ncbi:MAG: rhodanese-like domain-containing protein [Candidatus Bathyarchaeia archaeon]